jgi:methylenetetrahydrofolate reductase (NADPH)
MRIRELLTSGRPAFSFEFFPPKPENRGLLLETIVALQELKPTYISVTYGAGGSTRDLTVELVGSIKRDYGIETMAHLTCVGASKDEIASVVDRLASAGIENVLALRGDPPRGQTDFKPVADGFRYGAELAAFIKHRFRLCVAGACYPEKHPECASFDQDLLYLREKVHAGAEFLITQLFFDNQKYFDFVAKARAIGIGVPIVPGIMPITNLAQVERITKMCGASIPETLLTEMQRVQDKPDAVLALGIAQATAQCLELLHRGAPGIHFYTLNKSAATRMILTAIRTVWPPARYPA